VNFCTRCSEKVPGRVENGCLVRGKRVRAFLLENWLQKLAALVIALGLWFVVTFNQPGQRTTLPSIPLDTSSLPDSLAITKGRTTVSVEVTAKGESLPDLGIYDIEAYVDLSSAQTGTHLYPVRLRYPSWLDRVAVLRPRPEEVELTVERVVRRRLVVSVHTVGQSDRFEVRRWVLTPQAVWVEGAESVVARVISARVSMDMSQLEIGGRYERLVEVLDANDRPVEPVSVDPKTVVVRAELVSLPTLKRLVVLPAFEGALPLGVRLTSYEVVPNTVVVRGEPSQLAQVSTVETEPINLSSLRGDREVRVRLRLPQGLTLDEGEQEEVKVFLRAVRSGP
jgi:YbbR domain-containing protein